MTPATSNIPKVAVFPAQKLVAPVIVGAVGLVPMTTLIESMEKHPESELTFTVYFPLVLTEIELSVEPLPHKYVRPAPLRSGSKTIEVSLQMLMSVPKSITGAIPTEIEILAVGPVQPFILGVTI